MPALGRRVFIGHFQEHTGELDAAGMPKVGNDYWRTVVADWPCARVTKTGTETNRGLQRVAEQGYTFTGDPRVLVGKVDTTCRLVVRETAYDITSISGLDALSDEATVECEVQR